MDSTLPSQTRIAGHSLRRSVTSQPAANAEFGGLGAVWSLNSAAKPAANQARKHLAATSVPTLSSPAWSTKRLAHAHAWQMPSMCMGKPMPAMCWPPMLLGATPGCAGQEAFTVLDPQST